MLHMLPMTLVGGSGTVPTYRAVSGRPDDLARYEEDDDYI
jgi:hypothetical protein